MARVANGIKRWKKDKIGDTKLQLAIVKEVLLQLEAAQEHRLLTEKEKVIRDYFKNHIGSVVPRTSTIKWQPLGYNQHDHSDLEVPFSHDEAFGIFSGLHINLQKSSVHPISCGNVDLDQVLSPFTGSRGDFPCKYLGLQLHVRSLQKVHMQPLIERIRQRLPRWKGRWLNKAGRLTLVTYVLSSMPTYHLTVFPLAAWAKKKIDKIRRSFLWKGEENANGGHCLVNWPTVTRPKDLGGLGVSDFDRFGRALWLRWLWQEWVDDSKSWSGSELPCTDDDRHLFNSSIIITLGDGAKTMFWHHNWLDGQAPRYLAPNLFRLVSRRNRTVQQELQNNNWIRSLERKVTSAVHIEEFVSLWI
ncbi:unnamed protein product [Miscanthus lutarioriparius]|uniref:Uncharacterized protein n=1 Tax=Miscanthus lutarioriparius TaxID=422564 RepID=A0A811QRE3_9POAL|nr:unnamed protein product [Miscanthus lutarioriparius]